MHYICCSCNRGRMIWSLQRGRSLLGEAVNRSFTPTFCCVCCSMLGEGCLLLFFLAGANASHCHPLNLSPELNKHTSH